MFPCLYDTNCQHSHRVEKTLLPNCTQYFRQEDPPQTESATVPFLYLLGRPPHRRHRSPVTKVGSNWSCRNIYISLHNNWTPYNVSCSDSAPPLSWTGPCFRAAITIDCPTHTEATVCSKRIIIFRIYLLEFERWRHPRPLAVRNAHFSTYRHIPLIG